MNIAQLLLRSATVYPERPAILHGAQVLYDYRTFAKRAAAIAGGLRDRGYLAGDRVAVFMTNCPEYLEVLYGTWWAGLVAVPVNAKLHPRELAFVLADAEACCLFVSADLAGETGPLVGSLLLVTPGTADYAELLGAAPLALQPRAPDDVAWLFYTSGTTGQPKGVMETHRNLLGMTSCYFSDVDPVDPDDAILYAAPISHGAGLYNFAHVLKAARHVVPVSGGFDPAELCELAESVGRLSFFAAPTMVRRLVEHVATSGADPRGFKTIVYGGGPMYVEDIRRGLDVLGNRFVQIYGQGECPMTITALSREQLADRAHPRWAERIASVGVAQSLVEVRVADADGNALPVGETGEILVRGEIVMAGYWRNPEATAKTLRDGWLWTGDLGSLDADGFLTLRDRSKDVIISGGSNIYPREVEETLLKHPAVREVAVVGCRDAEWGEVVVAFVVGADVSSAELDALCLEQIARFKRPKEYHFVDELPKNNYGKVLKTELRQRL
ncbi:class I adenylate-forming enzyme family protein [Dechloromonas sp. A34]|uniref:class I adenylate-forming enzyme family protein n=1 Tax=Dechloromonas sp. A34 TaxID=447588 RepID=UPI0022492CAB|nr:AMP-binding protein [Dechloromonas sp. A34]